MNPETDPKDETARRDDAPVRPGDSASPNSLARRVLLLAQGRPMPLIRWLRVAWTGFNEDQCVLRASALAFTSALSLVPLLAVAFSISKGFGFQNTTFIQQMLGQFTGGKQEVVDTIIGYINNTNVKTLGMVGVGILFMTVISLLGTIEKSFNSIWGVKTQRGLWRKFSDYLTVTLVCPLLIIIAMSSTASLQSSAMMQNILSMSVLSTLYVVALKLLPFFTNWLALLFVYTFMPNTRVRLPAALTGAVVAGTVWQLVQWTYIHYQASFKNYNAIYGSFAQVPLFLLWMFITWVIVLMGAEICFAVQHSSTFSREKSLTGYSFDDRVKLGVLILSLLTDCFLKGRPSPNNEDIAAALDAPVKLVNDVLHMLSVRRIVARMDCEDGLSYGLAQPPGQVRLLDVMLTMSRYKESRQTAINLDSYAVVGGLFDIIRDVAGDSETNMTLEEFTKAHAPAIMDRTGLKAREKTTESEPEPGNSD